MNDIPGPGAYRYKSSIDPKGNNFISNIKSSGAPLIGGSGDRFKGLTPKYHATPGPGTVLKRLICIFRRIWS